MLKISICSCSKLGIEPPVLLGLQDGLGLIGHGNFYEQIPTLKKKLLNTIKKIKPIKIITFGPEGDTGHPDHRLVGNVTTEVVLQEGLTNEIELFYFGWSKEQAMRYHWWDLSYVDENNLDTKIEYSDTDKEKGIEAILCYKSQYDHEEMSKWIEVEESNSAHYLFFRKMVIDQNKKSQF